MGKALSCQELGILVQKLGILYRKLGILIYKTGIPDWKTEKFVWKEAVLNSIDGTLDKKRKFFTLAVPLCTGEGKALLFDINPVRTQLNTKRYDENFK